jgi:TfoX/Sxy family transcriptional regulator of competence genes
VPAERPEASPVPASFAPVVSAFARDRSVTRGKMFSSSNVLSVNGKIFAMLVRGKLVVKLPKQRVDGLVAARAGTYFDPGHGRLMKQWISIPAAKANWVELAREALRFVKAR